MTVHSVDSSAFIGLGLCCMSPHEMLRRERARFVLGKI